MVHIIGGGLAGSEAAWQAAELGVDVTIHEMRPVRPTAVHQTGALAELGSLLGAGIGSLVNVFDPDVVIVGGGFGASAGELVLASAREAARAEALAPAAERVRIVRAELGAGAGLIGAGLVGFEALDGER